MPWYSLPGAVMASPLGPPVLPISVPTCLRAHWSQCQLHPWAYLLWCPLFSQYLPTPVPGSTLVST